MRFRVIPVLLIQNNGLVKGVRFKDYKYVGDPINAVKVFNDKEVDEICVIDISATAQKKRPNIDKIREIASEAFMPLAYGGGITEVQQIKDLIAGGVEKVVINTAAYTKPNLITEAAMHAGSQSIVVSIDVKKNWLGNKKVYIQNGSKSIETDPVEYAKKMEGLGAGEIMLQSIDRDGTFEGYDLDLIESVSKAISIPVISMGGASVIPDFRKAIEHGASAVAAGSMFVFQRPHRAVLISYPSAADIYK
jgi:imidazole glycerol-phosphate synthase subunit HisF